MLLQNTFFSLNKIDAEKGMPAAYLSARTTCPRFVHAFLKILLILLCKTILLFFSSLCWLTAKNFSYNFFRLFLPSNMYHQTFEKFPKNPSLAFYFIHVSSRYDIVVLKIYYDWNRLANKKNSFSILFA